MSDIQCYDGDGVKRRNDERLTIYATSFKEMTTSDDGYETALELYFTGDNIQGTEIVERQLNEYKKNKKVVTLDIMARNDRYLAECVVLVVQAHMSNVEKMIYVRYSIDHE